MSRRGDRLPWDYAAMRAFDELTAEVAESLRHDLESLDEGRSWRRVGPHAGRARTVADLDQARERSCRLLEGCYATDPNGFAIGAAESRANYAVGCGFVYTARPAPGVPADPRVVKDAQDFIDLFCEFNRLPEVEWEAVWRLDRDGDTFLRLVAGESPVPAVRFVTVKPPADAGAGVAGDADGAVPPTRAWGIESVPDDPQSVTGYWLEPAGGGDAAFHPEREVVHLKLNTDSDSPRGWPTFEPVIEPLRRAVDLLVAGTATGKARAKVALIESIPGFTAARAEEIAARLTARHDRDRDSGATPRFETVEELPYGARLRVREGTRIEFPSANTNSGELVALMQANLREAAMRLTMPEWMFTGVANATYANSFVSESPSLKAFERLQRMLATRLGTGRLGTQASLVWRAVRLGVAQGVLDPATLTGVTVMATGPTLFVRDKNAEASAYATLIGAKVLPVEQAQRELGYDPAELKRLAPPPPPDSVPGGPPGPPGDGGPVTESELRAYLKDRVAGGDWDAGGLRVSALVRYCVEAKRDLTRLVRVKRKDKNGVLRTVYVRREEDVPKKRDVSGLKKVRRVTADGIRQTVYKKPPTEVGPFGATRDDGNRSPEHYVKKASDAIREVATGQIGINHPDIVPMIAGPMKMLTNKEILKLADDWGASVGAKEPRDRAVQSIIRAARDTGRLLRDMDLPAAERQRRRDPSYKYPMDTARGRLRWKYAERPGMFDGTVGAFGRATDAVAGRVGAVARGLKRLLVG